MAHWLFDSFFWVAIGYDTNVSSVTIYLLPCAFPFPNVSLAPDEGLENQPVWVCKIMGQREVTDQQKIPNNFQVSSFSKGHTHGVCFQNYFKIRKSPNVLMLPI